MNLNDELAAKRTRWALERTQLAWIRTAFALTSAGIAIDKGAMALYDFKYTQSPSIVNRGFYIGSTLTIFASVQLIASTVQYVRHDRELTALTGLKKSSIPAVLPLALMVILLNIGVTIFLASYR